MMTELNRISQIALKNRVWTVTAIVLSFMAVIAFLQLIYTPKIELDKNYLGAKERERLALEKQTVAFRDLIEVQAERIVQLSKRDSSLVENSKQLLNNVIINGKDIKKIKLRVNERYNRFSSFSSNDWASYFANLPEPGQFADSK